MTIFRSVFSFPENKRFTGQFREQTALFHPEVSSSCLSSCCLPSDNRVCPAATANHDASFCRTSVDSEISHTVLRVKASSFFCCCSSKFPPFCVSSHRDSVDLSPWKQHAPLVILSGLVGPDVRLFSNLLSLLIEPLTEATVVTKSKLLIFIVGGLIKPVGGIFSN